MEDKELIEVGLKVGLSLEETMALVEELKKVGIRAGISGKVLKKTIKKLISQGD